MDPKVYIFFFMVFLSIVLADYMHAYKFGDSRMIQENSDVHHPAHQNGKTGQTVQYNHDHFSTKIKKSITKRSSHKSSKKSKKSRHRKRKIRTTTEPENTNIYKSDVIISKNYNDVTIKHRQIPETLRRRSESMFNRHTDNSNIEINNTGLANNGQDISIAPLKPDLRNKRKFDKKYRPEFEYVKLDHDTKKYNSRNHKTDIPDNAEAILEDSDEAYMKVLPPKIQKPNHRKGTEFLVHYDNFEEPKSDDNLEDEKLKQSRQFSQERREQQETIKLKANNIEIIDDPAASQRKYNPIFQYSNFHDKRRFPNDYSDVVDSGVDVIEITTTTTKAPETTTFGNTEIIYLTPNPENKKYKPIFKYQAVANEPYNYDMQNHRNANKDKAKYASDDSNSESEESEETNNNEKIIVDLGDNDNDEDSGKQSSEENESKSEENSKEKRDSDRDNEFFKISRKIRARDRPFDVKKYYNKVIHENIKEPENIKHHASFELQDNIGEQRRQIKRPHTRNFVKVEKAKLEPNEISMKAPTRDTNGHTKIFLTEMETPNKPYFSPNPGPTAINQIESLEKSFFFGNVKDKLSYSKQPNTLRAKISEKYATMIDDVSAKPVVLLDKERDRFEPGLFYNRHSHKVHDKISKKDTTNDYEVSAQPVLLYGRVTDKYAPGLPYNKVYNTTSNYDVTTKPVTYKYKEDNMVYHPDIEYNEQFDQIREKFSGKGSTAAEEMKIFRPSQLKKNYETTLEDFERKRKLSLDERYGDLYAEKNYKNVATEFERKKIPAPDETYRDINAEKNFKYFLEDIERKRKLKLDKRYRDVSLEKTYKTVPEDFETKEITTLIPRLGDIYAEKQTVTEKSATVHEEEDRSTEPERELKKESTIFRPSELKKNYGKNLEDFERKRNPTLDEKYGDSYAEKKYKNGIAGFGRRRILTPDEKYVEKNYKSFLEDIDRKRKSKLDKRYGDESLEKNYKTDPKDFEKNLITTIDATLGDIYAEKPTVTEKLGTVHEEEDRPTEPEKELGRETTIFQTSDRKKKYRTNLEDIERKRNPTLDEKNGDSYVEKNYKSFLEDIDRKRKSNLEKRYGDVSLEKNYKTDPEDFEKKIIATIDSTLGDIYAEKQMVTEKIGTVHEEEDRSIEPEKERGREITNVIAADITTEKYQSGTNYIKWEYNEPEGSVYRKRSTRYVDSVKAVKINKAKIVEKLTTTTSEDLTTISDYGEINEQKVTENTPSYQVHENIADVPDTRSIPGPVPVDYVIVPDRYAPEVEKKSAIPAINLNGTDLDPEHPIANIVQGMKDYFTVIGKGLYTAVKDIFKEKPS